MIDCAGLMLYKKDLLIALGLNPRIASYYADNAPSWGISKKDAKEVVRIWSYGIENYSCIAHFLQGISCPYCIKLTSPSRSNSHINCSRCPYGSLFSFCEDEKSIWRRVQLITHRVLLVNKKDKAKQVIKEVSDYIERMK